MQRAEIVAVFISSHFTSPHKFVGGNFLAISAIICDNNILCQTQIFSQRKIQKLLSFRD